VPTYSIPETEFREANNSLCNCAMPSYVGFRVGPLTARGFRDRNKATPGLFPESANRGIRLSKHGDTKSARS